MDSVCRTCMRILGPTDASVSINNTDLREKLQHLMPELVLDSVVDPKMCGTCTAALSLSFRFKGMCSQSEKTIIDCLQTKSDEGVVVPLTENDLLTLGHRDIGDIIIDDDATLMFAEEIEIVSSIDGDSYLDQSETDTSIFTSPEGISYVGYLPKNAVIILDDSVLNDADEEITIASQPPDPNIFNPPYSSTIIESPSIPKKVIVDTAPVINCFDVTAASSTVKNRRGTRRKAKRSKTSRKFVHKTGEDELIPELSTVSTVLEPPQLIAHEPTCVKKTESNKLIIHSIVSNIPKAPEVPCLPTKKVTFNDIETTQPTPPKTERALSPKASTEVESQSSALPEAVPKPFVSPDREPRKTSNSNYEPRNTLNPELLESRKTSNLKLLESRRALKSKRRKVSKLKRPESRKTSNLTSLQSLENSELPIKSSDSLGNTSSETTPSIRATRKSSSPRRPSTPNVPEELSTSPKSALRKSTRLRFPTQLSALSDPASRNLLASKLRNKATKQLTFKIPSQLSVLPLTKSNDSEKPSRNCESQELTKEHPVSIKPNYRNALSILDRVRNSFFITNLNRNVSIRLQKGTQEASVKQASDDAANNHKSDEVVVKPDVFVIEEEARPKSLATNSKTDRIPKVNKISKTPKRKVPKTVNQDIGKTYVHFKKNKQINAFRRLLKTDEYKNLLQMYPDSQRTLIDKKIREVTANFADNTTNSSDTDESPKFESLSPPIKSKPQRTSKCKTSKRVRSECSDSDSTDAQNSSLIVALEYIPETESRIPAFKKKLKVSGSKDIYVDFAVSDSAAKNTCQSNARLDYALSVKDPKRKQNRCEFCGKTFRTESALDSHCERHFSAGDNLCKACGKYFATENVLSKHICESENRTVPKRRRRGFVCRICGCQYNSKWSLLEHYSRHQRFKALRFVCDLCPKSFIDKSAYDHHKLHHIQRPIQCRCHLLYRSRERYERHLEAGVCRATTKLYRCHFCTALYRTDSNRNLHMRIKHIKHVLNDMV